MHNYWAVTDPAMAQIQQAMFMKNISMLGSALLIAYFGSGPFSLDERIASRSAAMSKYNGKKGYAEKKKEVVHEAA
ncbi:MAG TPA: DoxX family protein [Chitinophagales bacterium]|nr:DoxX family protein [Chitinophagales bacterium]